MFFLKIILCSQTDTHDRSHYYYSTRCRTIKTARHRVGGHGDWRRRLSHWSGHLPRWAGRHGDVLPPVNVSQPIRIRRRDSTCSGEKGSDKNSSEWNALLLGVVDFYRAKCGLCCRPMSVCLSVRPSRSCIISKRLKISSNFIIIVVAPSFWFPGAVQCYPIPRGTHSAGAELNTLGCEKIAIFD